MARTRLVALLALAAVAAWLVWSYRTVQATHNSGHGYTCPLASYEPFRDPATGQPFRSYEGTLGEHDTALTRAAFNAFAGDADFRLPALNSGPRSNRTAGGAAPYIPPILLKSIAWLESGWTQAAWDVPRGATGTTLVSVDCGYGLMQVTSGMQNTGAPPNRWQQLVASNLAYNAAAGAQILAQKWNLPARNLPIVGDGDPTLVENWYFAVWAYNGFSAKNNPWNPNLPWPRSAYRCDGTQPRSNYPYQELVWGCAANPPRDRNGNRIWAPIPLTLPDRSLIKPNLHERFAAGTVDASDDIPTTPGGTRDPTTVGSPALTLNPAEGQVFILQPGQRGPDGAVAVQNTGTGLLSWAATSNQSWLKLVAGSGLSLGSDQGSQAGNVIFYADATGLSVGTYTGTITVSAPGAGGSPQTIQVTLVVANPVHQGAAPGSAR